MLPLYPSLLSFVFLLLTTAAVPEKCDSIYFSSYYTNTAPFTPGPDSASFSFMLRNDKTN
jgi:hypothetical protein